MNNISGTITLDDFYYIDVDPLNFILKERKSVKVGENKGRQYDSTIGYFGSLESALNAYVELLEKRAIGSFETTLSIGILETMLEEIKTAVTKLSLTLTVKQEEKA